MTPADIDRVFGTRRLRMVTGDHVEVFREASVPGERRRYTKRFLATSAGDFREWTEREWRILARLVGHGIKPVPDVVRFDRGAADRPALVQTYDAGVTVDHWATLLPLRRDGALLRNVFEDCAHWWALARHCLIALDAIHELQLVHLDLKADNVCIPVAPADFDPRDAAAASTAARAAARTLQPRFEDIALIDFAFSLVSGERLQSALPIAAQREYEYQSPRLLHALEAGRKGDLAPTRELDWRCDFFSLAAMLDRYLPAHDDCIDRAWTRPRHAKARDLIGRLMALHGAELPAKHPHAELIALTGDTVAQPDLRLSLQRGWTLAIDAGVTTGAAPTPVTRIAPALEAAAPRGTTAPLEATAACEATASLEATASREATAPLEATAACEATASLEATASREATAPLEATAARGATAPLEATAAREATAPLEAAAVAPRRTADAMPIAARAPLAAARVAPASLGRSNASPVLRAASTNGAAGAAGAAPFAPGETTTAMATAARIAAGATAAAIERDATNAEPWIAARDSRPAPLRAQTPARPSAPADLRDATTEPLPFPAGRAPSAEHEAMSVEQSDIDFKSFGRRQHERERQRKLWWTAGVAVAGLVAVPLLVQAWTALRDAQALSTLRVATIDPEPAGTESAAPAIATLPGRAPAAAVTATTQLPGVQPTIASNVPARDRAAGATPTTIDSTTPSIGQGTTGDTTSTPSGQATADATRSTPATPATSDSRTEPATSQAATGDATTPSDKPATAGAASAAQVEPASNGTTRAAALAGSSAPPVLQVEIRSDRGRARSTRTSPAVAPARANSSRPTATSRPATAIAAGEQRGRASAGRIAKATTAPSRFGNARSTASPTPAPTAFPSREAVLARAQSAAARAQIQSQAQTTSSSAQPRPASRTPASTPESEGATPWAVTGKTPVPSSPAAPARPAGDSGAAAPAAATPVAMARPVATAIAAAATARDTPERYRAPTTTAAAATAAAATPPARSTAAATLPAAAPIAVATPDPAGTAKNGDAPSFDFGARADELMANDVPRWAQRAERLVGRVLFLAGRADNVVRDGDVVGSAASLGRAAADAGGGAPTSPREAQLLNAAARNEYARRGATTQAVQLQVRAFGANPLDPEIAGNLAFLLLRARPAQPAAARQLALHALTLPNARTPQGRVEDWATLAIASALAGRERDARNALLVSLAVAPNHDRQCRAALDVYAMYGERLRAPVEAMLYSAHASANGQPSPFCEWPPHWTVSDTTR